MIPNDVPGLSDLLEVRTMGDALGIGLELTEIFAMGGDVCAVWLGAEDGSTRDFIVCNEHRGRDVDQLVQYAAVGARALDVSRVVLWRSDDDLTDGPELAATFFDHRDLLEEAGAVLVDEIVLGDDEVRSMAVTTFTDEPGWDDVSDRIAALDGE